MSTLVAEIAGKIQLLTSAEKNDLLRLLLLDIDGAVDGGQVHHRRVDLGEGFGRTRETGDHAGFAHDEFGSSPDPGGQQPGGDVAEGARRHRAPGRRSAPSPR